MRYADKRRSIKIFREGTYALWKSKQKFLSRRQCASCQGDLEKLGSKNYAPRGETYLHFCPACSDRIIDWNQVRLNKVEGIKDDIT